jgi:predicted secreted protein
MKSSWRLVVLGLALAGLAPQPAQADGDQAHLAIIGFAKDGSAFAFEQFGWQNNSTFPFSELSVIETSTGKFFAGMPFQSAIAVRGAVLQTARLMVYAAARPVLDQRGITEPGVIAGRASGDPNDKTALTMSFDAPTLGPVTITVAATSVKSVGCEAADVKVKALALRLVDAKGALIRNLFLERAPPTDRLCPTGYGIAEVRYFPRKDKPPILAIIIGFDRPAFGGLDRRYMGVTIDLATAATPVEPAKE